MGVADYISRALVADALTEWRELLRARATVSPLRDLATSQAATIDLAGSHPSGLAQLFAGRPTLFSTLMRDRDAYHAASFRGGVILDQAEALMVSTGTWSAALVVGTVEWDGVQMPLLLRPVSLERAREDDMAVTLRHDVYLNPVFAAVWRDLSGPGDLSVLAASTLAGKEFDPRPLWAEVRDNAHLFGGLELSERLLLGAFDDQEQRLLDDLDALDAVIGASDVIAAIAGDADARAILAEPLPRWSQADRDPFGERGLGRLDDVAFAALDLVAMGRSLVIDAPPGADAVGVAAAIAADAAASGRTAAVIGGSDASLAAVDAALRHVGAGDIAITGVGAAWHADARKRLLASLTLDTPRVGEEELRHLGDELLRARAEVTARFDALHRPRRPWGASAFEAVQAIVRLTASDPAPATSMRLGASAGAAVAEHGLAHVVATLVARLHGTEVEVPSEIATPVEDDVAPVWWERVAESADQGLALDAALAAVVREFGAVRTDAATAATATGVDEAGSLDAWREQVRLFSDVQVTLDTFSPAVYHRSLADLVAATAPRGADADVDIPRRVRRALVRRATEMLRPGRDKATLHERLAGAQDEAQRWRAHCSAGGWPVVPDAYAAYASRMGRVEDAWAVLEPVLFDASGLEEAGALPWSELASALQDLVDGIPGGIARAPVAPAAVNLDEAGFADLIADLEARAASPDQARVDLEFAWWASAFEAMVEAEPALIEQGALGAAVERYLDFDNEFADRRAEPLMRAVAEHRRRAISRHPEDARDLFATLMEASEASVKDLRRDFGPVVTALRPVVIARADQVPHALPAGRCVDLLVLVGAEALATAQVIPSLARATQVVVVADTLSATRSAVAEIAALLPHVRLRALPQARDPRVSAVLSRLGYDKSMPVVPAPGDPARADGLTVTTVDGVAQPVAGRHVVESTRAEVSAVVEQVQRIAATVPRRTVAVIAGNALHASRVTEALAERLPSGARVLVVELGDATGLDVDEVILSLGYARDHRGVLPADVGILATSTGAAALAQALVAARSSVHVFAALEPHHIATIAQACAGTHGVDAFGELIAAAKRPALPPERSAPGTSDWLLADVAHLLRAEGLAVRLRYGVGGQAIPMVVGDVRDRGYKIAVVTDEPSDGLRGSVRDRVRWQYGRLEALGWTVVSLWTLDVFMDPAGAAATVRDAVRAVGGSVATPAIADAASDDADESGADESGADDLALEDFVTEDVVTQDVVTEDVVLDDAALDDAAVEDAPADATANDDLEPEPEPEPESEPDPEPDPEPEPEPEPALEPTDAPEPDVSVPTPQPLPRAFVEAPLEVDGFNYVPAKYEPATPAPLDGDAPSEAAAPEPEASATDEAAEPPLETEPERWEQRKPPTKGVGRPLIPTRAWEDEDAAWGDRGSSRDDEIKRDRPPHW